MNFLFRVDAGGEIGLGHFYRSAALANEIKKRGHKVIFHHKKSIFWDNIKENFEFKSIEFNKKSTLDIILKEKIDILFVDGIIDFDKNEINEIKKYTKLIFFQNLAKSRKYADIFILPSLNYNYNFLKIFPVNTKIYKGLEYIIFNSIVKNLATNPTARLDNNIGIIAGGYDPKNCLEKIFYLIDYKKFNNLTFTFYYGVDNVDKLNSIQNCINSNKFKYSNVRIEIFVHSKIITNTLLISAFGVSTLEFLALGMPILSFAHSKKNLQTLKTLQKKTKSLINLGFIEELNSNHINDIINQIIYNKEELSSYSAKAKTTISLNGLKTVSKILINA